MFDRWRNFLEQFFNLLEYLLFKVFLFVMALLGAWAVIHWHIK
jgi:hypothetical protein